jgi:hypothetical protein
MNLSGLFEMNHFSVSTCANFNFDIRTYITVYYYFFSWSIGSNLSNEERAHIVSHLDRNERNLSRERERERKISLPFLIIFSLLFNYFFFSNNQFRSLSK